MTARPRVGMTMGDPAGIGPEIVLKALAQAEVRQICAPVVYGDLASNSPYGSQSAACPALWSKTPAGLASTIPPV